MRCPFCNGVMTRLPREVAAKPTYLCETPSLADLATRRSCGVTLVPTIVAEAPHEA